MRQSRLMSLVEALANVVVGYGVAVLTQMLVFPLFGLEDDYAENLAIGAIFTVVSLARSYALRRTFERLRESRLPNGMPTNRRRPGGVSQAQSAVAVR